MVPKDSPKTAPCRLAQPKKILRDFMVSGEVSEPDTTEQLFLDLMENLHHVPFRGFLSWLGG